MTDLFSILIGIILANEFVLSRLTGTCPYFGPGERPARAVAASLATGIVLVPCAALTAVIDSRLLLPLAHGELQLILCTVLVALAAPMARRALYAANPGWRERLSPWPLQINVNAALLAAVLASKDRMSAVVPAIGWAASAALAFGLTVILYAELRRRLDDSDVPQAFRGTAIALVTGGFLSLAFSALASIVGG